jgi:elongation factor P--beta-lysine ligase
MKFILEFNDYTNRESSYITENNTYKTYLSYDELSEVMFEITDEFTELEWYVEESKYSHLLKEECSKSFIIELVKNKEENFLSSNEYLLYYLEPKIFSLISEISNKLGMYNLYVSASDFGETDESYELVITEIGHKPLLKE